MTDKRLRVLCQKTKMCRFHILGHCGKGEDCSFAHHADEMRQTPDLFRTKVCPTLIREGRCQDPQCGFAHNGDQLRTSLGKARAPAPVQLRAPTTVQPMASAPMQRRAPASQQVDFAAQVEEADIQQAHDFAERSIMTQTELPLKSDDQGGSCDGSDGATTSSGPAKEEKGQKALRNKFHKTKICAFNTAGRCRKGNRCNFAHTTVDVRPLPDLYCTKLCPLLGECQDPQCSFAHSEKELRTEDAPLSRPGPAMRDIDTMPSTTLTSTCTSSTGSVVGDGASSEPPGQDSEDSDSLDEDEGFGLQDMTRQRTEDPSRLTARQLRVKNTFLELDLDDEETLQKRSKSCVSAHRPPPQS